MRSEWVLLGLVVILLWGGFFWSLDVEFKVEEENKLIRNNYMDEVVQEIKRADGDIIVHLANGDLRKVEVNGGQVKELVAKELEVNLKEDALDKITTVVSDQKSKDAELTKEDVKTHYKNKDKIVLNIQAQENGKYLVELVKEYILVDTQGGKIQEEEREEKSGDKE